LYALIGTVILAVILGNLARFADFLLSIFFPAMTFILGSSALMFCIKTGNGLVKLIFLVVGIVKLFAGFGNALLKQFGSGSL